MTCAFMCLLYVTIDCSTTFYFLLFQLIFPHFLNAIRPHIEDHWSEDVANAWKTFFKIITYYMELGISGADPKHVTDTFKVT